MSNDKDNTTAHNASEYDGQIQKTIPFYAEFHSQTIQLVRACNPAPKVWLDTGCGTGRLIKESAPLFPSTRFILSDPSEAMLGAAKATLAGLSGRVEFLLPAVTQEIRLSQDMRPDVITAIQAHHYLSPLQRESATKRCFDLLAANGLFITFENIRPMTETGIRIGKQNWGSYQISKGKTEEQAEKHLERFDTEYFPITIEEHLSLYRRCGFKVVEVLWYSYMQAGFYCIK